MLSYAVYAYFTCDDKDIYDEVHRALLAKDIETSLYLIYKSGHFITTDTILKNKMRYSIEKAGWGGTSQIRLWDNNHKHKSIILYVPTEFLCENHLKKA